MTKSEELTAEQLLEKGFRLIRMAFAKKRDLAIAEIKQSLAEFERNSPPGEKEMKE